ncbi:MAG: VOC family protein [Desulfitobacteriaceae bacterium]|nr:VOC family protein [Desulfitobacteriaceae bacterium]
MKLSWVTLYVKNLEESLKFYQKIVGLNLVEKFNAGPGVEIAFLGNGETKIELIYNEAIKEVNLGENISLGFEVDSLDKMMTFVKEKGINIHSGPFQPNPHIKFFFIMDPNGLKIQFAEHI